MKSMKWLFEQPTKQIISYFYYYTLFFLNCQLLFISKQIYDSFNTISHREILTDSNGNLLKEGGILKRPKLATTFEAIAADPLSFYQGSLAEDIVADIKEKGEYCLLYLNIYLSMKTFMYISGFLKMSFTL